MDDTVLLHEGILFLTLEITFDSISVNNPKDNFKMSVAWILCNVL